MKIGKHHEVVGHWPLSRKKDAAGQRTGIRSLNPLPLKIRRNAAPRRAVPELPASGERLSGRSSPTANRDAAAAVAATPATPVLQRPAVVDRTTGASRAVHLERSRSGDGTIHKLLDDASGAIIGSMTTASRQGALRILSIENHARARFRGAGTVLYRRAVSLSHEMGLQGRVSLLCQDEGAAEFFYKQGLRFVGEQGDRKNDAMAAHLEQPLAALPDDILFLGDMELSPVPGPA